MPSVLVLLFGEKIATFAAYKKLLLITNNLAPPYVSQAIVDIVDDRSSVMVVAQKEMELEGVYLGQLSRLLMKGVTETVENVFGNEIIVGYIRKVRYKHLCISG